MEKLRPTIIATLCVSMLLTSCKKESTEEHATMAKTSQERTRNENTKTTEKDVSERTADEKTVDRLAPYAKDALKAATEATAALRRSDAKSATKHINAALAALDKIEAEEPSVRFSREIIDSSGEHKLDERVPLGPAMITFRKEVWKDNRLIEDPTESLKKAKGDKRQDLLLVDSKIHYASWALPVAGSHNRLLAAKELIDRKKLAKALDVVESVITNVDTFNLTVQSPLWKVRGLVSSARVAVAEGEESSAVQSLARAQKRLAKIIDPASDQSSLPARWWHGL